MCYQTKLLKSKTELLERFKGTVDDMEGFQPQKILKAFDFPKTPVITHDAPDKIQCLQWGLIPSWSNDNSIRNYTLNARIETITEKPAFKEATHNRCLVLADGFYEWQWLTASGSKKEKYQISLPNDALFAFAGIYSHWVDSEGISTGTYSIITTEANELMSKIHNSKKRMPVILSADNEQDWLQGAPINTFANGFQGELIATNLDRDPGQLGLF